MSSVTIIIIICITFLYLYLSNTGSGRTCIPDVSIREDDKYICKKKKKDLSCKAFDGSLIKTKVLK